MPTNQDDQFRRVGGREASDWKDVQPLLVDMLTSLRLIAQLRGKTLLSQLIELAKAEALKPDG